MKTDTSRIAGHFQTGLVAAAGLLALASAWWPQAELPATIRACYFVYGILFLVGAVASLLSLIAVAPLAGFPLWVNGSMAEKASLVLGTIVAAGLVAGPLLASRDGKEA
jgi:hypothetical protein